MALKCPRCGEKITDPAAACPVCFFSAESLQKLWAEEAPPVESNLIECPDCGHEISKHAAACPNCGAPFQRDTVFRRAPRVSAGPFLGTLNLGCEFVIFAFFIAFIFTSLKSCG